MKWPVFLHSFTSFVGKGLRPEHKALFSYLQKELHRYLTAYSLREDLMKDFLKSWVQINTEPFLPILQQIMKLIRHRLISANALVYHRLVHLINALMRQGGTAAHALIGRDHFLRTIVYCMKQHAISRQILSNDSAALSFRFLKEWKEGLAERRDLFPYYEKAFEKASLSLGYLNNLDISHLVLTNVEKEPVRVAEEYRRTEGSHQFEENGSSSPSKRSSISSPVTPDKVRGNNLSQRQSLSIAVPDDESLNLNRVSSLNEAPLPAPSSPSKSSASSPSSVLPVSPSKRRSGGFTPKFEAAKPSSSNKLIITVVEEPQSAVKAAESQNDDDSTVDLDRYYSEMDRVSKRISTGTVHYETVYEPGRSSQNLAERALPVPPAPSSAAPTAAPVKLTVKTKSIELSDSAHGRSLVSPSSKDEDKEKVDVTFKYYGTQRVVSYKKSQKNLVPSSPSQQAIFQQ